VGNSTPEDWADALVVVDAITPGGPLFVQFKPISQEPILFGPYENPDLARKDAAKARQFLAELIHAARAGGG
jgi:hypothetical protein